MSREKPYRSFWMGGFEGADHINGLGTALDMSLASGHIDRLDEDYANAARFGLRSVRESVGWRLAEPARGRYDFDRVRRIADAARRHGVQVVWTLMHYGTPADVDVYSDSAIGRFADFAEACARAIGPLGDEAPIYNLINEINFYSWAVSETEMIHPYRRDRPRGAESPQASGYGVKRRLVRAVLAAIERVKQVDPLARFAHIEPLLHVAVPAGRDDLQELADRIRSYQWQAWDLIGGLAEPELGGNAEALDLIGVNYYHSGQWEASTEARLDWFARDPRRRRFSSLLEEAWTRYRRPMFVAETSHIGAGRAAWLHEIGSEVAGARERGIPVDGICLYPLVDRNDWSDPHHWHRSGLWDAGSDGDPAPLAAPERLLHLEYADALTSWQRRLPEPDPRRTEPLVTLLVFCERRWNGLRFALQQLMYRLARDYRVLVVEPPVASAGSTHLDRRPQAPDLEVLVAHAPAMPGSGASRQDKFGDRPLDDAAARLIANERRDRGGGEVVAWLTTPDALPMLDGLHPRAVVYDCRTLPAALRASPAAMARADLVLTASSRVEAALQPLHRNVHRLPAAVELSAFDPQRLPADTEEGRSVAHAQRAIAEPRLGYFGRIDERIDFGLLTELADRRPHWRLVLIGPVEGIDAGSLPQRPNIHWLGLQPYRRLGYFAAGWQALLLPYRADCSAQGKWLEYLATGQPVVSTVLPEAVDARHLRMAAGADAFIAACETALAEGSAQRSKRIDELRPLLEDASWEHCAEAARHLVEAALRRAGGVP